MTALSPAEAARRLGISAKALRLYEQRGLVTPLRSATGWRSYGPAAMARATDIVALRALGFSLAQITRVLAGDSNGLDPALAAQQAVLDARIRDLVAQAERIGALRQGLAEGRAPTLREITQLATPAPGIAFDLPWPWGGERFVLDEIRPLTHITGPLGSGKTRFARRLAEALPNAAFIGLDRTAPATLDPDAECSLAWLVEDGATRSDALMALVAALAAEGPAMLVIDMIEQGLDHDSQAALIAQLRRRGPKARPVFFLTRSSTILDPAAAGPDEAIYLCPANHAPPIRVAPFPGTPGYEALATCLATPEVRARIAIRPAVA